MTPRTGPPLRTRRIPWFDVTRQLQSRTYYILNGDDTLKPVASTPKIDYQADFPWLRNPVQDNELPNDDKDDKDEDNRPSLPKPGDPTFLVGRIYSWDTPGNPIAGVLTPPPDNQLMAFWVDRLTFKEWVRIKVNRISFEDGERVEGSRASAKRDWSLVYYATLGDDAKKWRDFEGKAATGSTDVNKPVLVSPAPANKGTAEVTLASANDHTDGYVATYTAATNRWTLVEKSTQNSVTADLDGTTWTLTLPGRLTLTITKTTTNFDNNDKFRFSVFNANFSPGGKINLWLAEFDVKAPP